MNQEKETAKTEPRVEEDVVNQEKETIVKNKVMEENNKSKVEVMESTPSAVISNENGANDIKTTNAMQSAWPVENDLKDKDSDKATRRIMHIVRHIAPRNQYSKQP